MSTFRSFPAIKFVFEVLAELKKVTWPTKNDTIKLTGLVTIVSLGVGIFVGGLDVLFTNVSALLFK